MIKSLFDHLKDSILFFSGHFTIIYLNKIQSFWGALKSKWIVRDLEKSEHLMCSFKSFLIETLTDSPEADFTDHALWAATDLNFDCTGWACKLKRYVFDVK